MMMVLVPLLAGAKPFYKLELSEHFNGMQLNPKVWSRIDRGGSDWNRNMSLRPDLVAVKGGQLHLYGKKNDDLTADPRTVLTGGVKTQGKLALKYGKVEIRCKLEARQGAWPAIWMMPEKPVRGWPADGEIDILERINFETSVHQTVHSKWTKAHPNNPPRTHQAPVKAEQWNVYGLEWTPEKLTWTINGKPTHSYPKVDDGPDQFPWQVPFFLMIDMQLGGAWAGPPKLETLPTAMHIDWVKIYSLYEDGKPVSELLINGEPKTTQKPPRNRVRRGK